MDRSEAVVFTILALVILAVFGLVALAFVKDQGPVIELNKDAWECTKQESYAYTTTMLVGKVTVPQVRTGSRCVRYELKER